MIRYSVNLKPDTTCAVVGPLVPVFDVLTVMTNAITVMASGPAICQSLSCFLTDWDLVTSMHKTHRRKGGAVLPRAVSRLKPRVFTTEGRKSTTVPQIYVGVRQAIVS